MFCCCSKVFKTTKLKSSEFPSRASSDRYNLAIEAPSTVSVHSPNPRTDSQLESLTDTSSVPHSLDHHTGPSPVFSLYFPSKDLFEPSSAAVLSEFPNFESILDLEADTDWEVKVEKPNALIMIRTGSPSHPEIPLMKAFFDLELDVEPGLVYSVIYDPEIRKKWDKSLAEYRVLRNEGDLVQYYMLNTAPWPFDDRDFVETRFIRRRINGDLEVYFRASFDQTLHNVREKTVRGEVVLGGQIFRKRLSPNTGKTSLIITTIVQADLKGEVPKKLLKVTLPASVFSWFRSVKQQVEVRLNQNLR